MQKGGDIERVRSEQCRVGERKGGRKGGREIGWKKSWKRKMEG